jgi:hypothetical protein
VLRRDFFPRWKAGQQWRVRIGRGRIAAAGFCHTDQRVVEVAQVPVDPDERDALLIHETAHAFRGCGGSHGRTWQGRLLRAARRARALGRERLATLLETEVEDYRRSIAETPNPAAAVYGLLGEWAYERPDVPYRKMLAAVAAQFGMTAAQMAKGFRRSRKVFREARDLRRSYERARAKILRHRQTEQLGEEGTYRHDG